MRTLVVACAVLALSASGPAQYWTGPYPIASDSSDEINPSACKEWVNDYFTCMAWQTSRNGNWDVCASFCDFRNGNGWQTAETLAPGYAGRREPGRGLPHRPPPCAPVVQPPSGYHCSEEP